MLSSKVFNSFLSPQSFLSRSAQVFRDKEAVVYRSQRLTYSQLGARVNQLASALRSWGLSKGERVAFLAPNIPPLLEAHFGVPLAGGVLVAMNIRLSSEDLRQILTDSGACLLFVDTEFSQLIAPIREELTMVREIVNIVDDQAETTGEKLPGLEYESFKATGSTTTLPSRLDSENDLISLNYTSGTSGQPKGVMYTHRGAYLNALGEALELKLDSRSVYLWTLPMFHCNGWCFPWGVVAVGGTHICLRKFVPEKVISLIKQERVTHFCGSPTILIMLLNSPSIKTLQLTHPLQVATAGAPPSPTLIQGMEKLGIEITHVYGLTETYGPHSICEWQQAWDNCPPGGTSQTQSQTGSALYPCCGNAGSGRADEGCPGRRVNHGGSGNAGQQRHERILQRPVSHGQSLSGRLVSQWRFGGSASRRLH